MSTRFKILAAVALGGAALTSPVLAQNAPAAKAAPQPKITPSAMKAIIDLQTAVNANDTANIPAKLAAAQAAAKSPVDRYFISQLQLKAAVTANDQNAQYAAIQAAIDSGGADAARVAELRLAMGNTKLKAKDYAGALAALQPVTQSNPQDIDATILTAESLNGLGRTTEAVPMFQKAIGLYQAQGKPVPQDVYRRTVALAYEKKLPVANTVALDWVKAYPTSDNWRDAIRIYSDGANLSDSDMLDLFRLQRVTKSLKGESDYFRYSSTAAQRGLPGEAKAVLDEGYAANAIDRNRPMFKETYGIVSGKVTADHASLAAAEKAALAGGTAKATMGTADAYLGYGDYAKAATLYRAALTKAGADKDQANLRLGIALARSGDKAGATAALNAVTGTRATVARYWLAWLGTQA